jgi:nitrogenase molybdenum-iron protein alpha/beta subunit
LARIPQLLTREKRLGAVSAYLGDILPLITELESGSQQRIRTFSQTAPDDIVQALRFLGGIKGAGIVVHGARGCANALIEAAPDGVWAVTNLNQRDTILGSETILAETVRALYRRHRPWAIFIVATPVVAINNDDIRAAADELSEELEIPVIEVRTDGFRSRISATGFDAAAQAVLPLIGRRDVERRADLINLLAVGGGRGLRHIISLLSGLGLEVNVLPYGADQAGFRRAASAALSITLTPDATDALSLGLEREQGVAHLRLPAPIGVPATDRFLASVAAATGRLAPPPLVAPPANNDLRGKRVVLALPPAAAFATADLLQSLGAEIVGVSVDHIDVGHIDGLKTLAAQWPNLPLHVGAGQPFEHANRLERLKPDLVIGSAELAAQAARAGVPALAVRADDLFGTLGVAHLLRGGAKALQNTKLVRRLANARVSHYQPAWFKRSPDWHIKFEVK